MHQNQYSKGLGYVAITNFDFFAADSPGPLKDLNRHTFDSVKALIITLNNSNSGK